MRIPVACPSGMKRKPAHIAVRAGKMEILKMNAGGWDWRDAYHWILALRWPHFVAFSLGVFLVVNLVFASIYHFGGPCIAEMPENSFGQAFFFSVETLATVGYGHMYPANGFGHVVVTIELISGMFWTAVMTGLIFVRFSRPTARLVFSKTMVVSHFDGKLTLMLRVANLRHQSMAEAEFRIMMMRDEEVVEGGQFRRFYPLKLTFDRLIMFPTALTLRHVIDESSPLHGMSPESLKNTDVRFIVSVVCVDMVICAPVQSQHDYLWSEVHFGERFVEIYEELPDGRFAVDYGRLHETEPAR